MAMTTSKVFAQQGIRQARAVKGRPMLPSPSLPLPSVLILVFLSPSGDSGGDPGAQFI
jgi:hypothetical protein